MKMLSLPLAAPRHKITQPFPLVIPKCVAVHR